MLLLVLLLAAGGLWYLRRLLAAQRSTRCADYEGRPADTPGTTWLLVGSDARDDLTRSRRTTLATGDATGQRTDTIMMLHIPETAPAKPTLLSCAA